MLQQLSTTANLRFTSAVARLLDFLMSESQTGLQRKTRWISLGLSTLGFMVTACRLCRLRALSSGLVARVARLVKGGAPPLAGHELRPPAGSFAHREGNLSRAPVLPRGLV